MLGTTLRRRYEIVKQLGSGGFSETYLARDLDFPGARACVVKHLKLEYSEDWVLKTARRLFQEEAEVLSRVGVHDHIPTLMAHFEENEQFFLVQEFIAGCSFAKELKQRRRWSPAEVLEFLRDLLGVLAFVHQHNVIHRDIKPANLIRRESDGRLVLIDFGSVKRVSTARSDGTEPTVLTVAVGTPTYMPPEQQHGKPRFSSDIYAVGRIAIRLLTGVSPQRLPEDPNTGNPLWRDRAPEVDDRFARAIARMSHWNFRERYLEVGEVLADLSGYEPAPVAPAALSSRALEQVDRAVADLKQHPEFSRIKKLLYCACHREWENDQQRLLAHRTRDLILDLYRQHPTRDRFEAMLDGIVQTLNKPERYAPVAEAIVAQFRRLYAASDSDISLPAAPPPAPPCCDRETEPSNVSLLATPPVLRPLAVQPPLAGETEKGDPTADAIAEPDIALPSGVLSLHDLGVSPFDLRLDIMKYTTPLRAKVLLFSVLHYQFGFSAQDWSTIKTYDLDELVFQLFHTFPTLDALRDRLQTVARDLEDRCEASQSAAAIATSLAPLYERQQQVAAGP